MSENDFNDNIWKSFENILNIVHNHFLKTEDEVKTKRSMGLIEIYFTKAILENLGTNLFTVNDENFKSITMNNAIEILNWIGNKESVDFIAKNFRAFNNRDCENSILNLLPEKFELVLRSPFFNEDNEQVVLSSILAFISKYENNAFSLLRYVNPEFLSYSYRIIYIESIIDGILKDQNQLSKEEIRGYFDNLLDESLPRGSLVTAVPIEIDSFLLVKILKALIKNKDSKIINLNKRFKSSIKARAKTVYSHDFSPSNVLFQNDKMYMSVRNIDSQEQWVCIDFPQDIIPKYIQIKTFGNRNNPKKLVIEALHGSDIDELAILNVPNEDQTAYIVNIEKSVFTQTVRVRMDGTTYWDDTDSYVLRLMEIVLFGFD